MRVLLVAETALPHMNGVSHSVLRVLEYLQARGHDVVVVAPWAGRMAQDLGGARLVSVPAVPMPGYPQVRMSMAGRWRMGAIIRAVRPDVIHLASPFLLGWHTLLAAQDVGLPTVAVYQTDVPAYAERYGVAALEATLRTRVARIHGGATLTLTPSTSAEARLHELGVTRLRRWTRGVDTERFHPRHRSDVFRATVGRGREVIVGYVGRLAPEKQVADLAVLHDLPGVRLLIVGEGPSRPALHAALPAATFTGFLGGAELATALASCDVFVHPGESETFGQTIQEALASGVPVVATGRGGPLDLVENSRTGWLYRPGDLADLRARVVDLVGDDAKRHAFGVAARDAMQGRSWDVLGAALVGHYRDAMTMAAQNTLPPTRTRVARLSHSHPAR